MSFKNKLKKWLKVKTYISFRDNKTLEENNFLILSNVDIVNLIIVFFITFFSCGLFSSTVYFKRYIDPSYQEAQNKLLIRELYRNFNEVKKNNEERNNFLLSIQNMIYDKNDFIAEGNVKNYEIKYFHWPISNKDITSNFEESGVFKIKADKDNKIFAITDGQVIYVNKNKKQCVLILQHINNVISIYTFKGDITKKITDEVSLGEIIGVVNTNSELILQIWNHGENVNPLDYLRN